MKYKNGELFLKTLALRGGGVTNTAQQHAALSTTPTLRWKLNTMLSINRTTYVFTANLVDYRRQRSRFYDSIMKLYIFPRAASSRRLRHWPDLQYIKLFSTDQQRLAFQHFTGLVHYPLITLVDYNECCFVPTHKLNGVSDDAADDSTNAAAIISSAVKYEDPTDTRRSNRKDDKVRELTFIVMPRYRTTLSRYLAECRRNKRTALADTVLFHEMLTVFYYISEAMHFLHDRNEPLVYMDLKPSNIVFDDVNKPILIDYGLVGTDLEFTEQRTTALVPNTNYVGTLVFCSIDAHAERWSIVGDYETLLFNLVYWLEGKVPWSLNNRLSVAQVLRMKRHTRSNKYQDLLTVLLPYFHSEIDQNRLLRLGTIVHAMQMVDHKYMTSKIGGGGGSSSSSRSSSTRKGGPVGCGGEQQSKILTPSKSTTPFLGGGDVVELMDTTHDRSDECRRIINDGAVVSNNFITNDDDDDDEDVAIDNKLRSERTNALKNLAAEFQQTLASISATRA